MHAEREEIVFKSDLGILPRYLWLFPFHLLIVLPVISLEATYLFWLAICFVAYSLMIMGLYMTMIREIHFGERITISRYLLRDQIAQYSDVQDVKAFYFKVNRTYIYWDGRYSSMKNGDELKQIVMGLVEKGIIDESKFPDKMTLTQITIIWAAGAFLGTLLTIAALAFGFGLNLDSGREFVAFIGFIYLVGFILSFVAGKSYFMRKNNT